MEIYKEIQGFEKLYAVSNTGKIKRFTKICNNKNNTIRVQKEGIMKININKKGYCTVILTKKSIRYNFRINRLVALHFKENPENKKEVNHLDGDKLNNNDYNLEWSTHLENVQHAWKTGLSKPNSTYKKVINIKTNYIYKSVREAAELNNLNENTLHYYLSGKLKNKTNLKYV